MKDAFGLKDTFGEKETSDSAYKQDSANLEILYQLLGKYTTRKVKIAFNLPLSMVTYQREGAAGADAAEDKPINPEVGVKRLRSRDGSEIMLTYEKRPPTMMLLREVNSFVKNNLFLALMDTTEVALANLARTDAELEADRITVIINIEDDFTRLIFLQGKDLFHVSSIIHEGVSSPENLEVIYRKLLYEQDEAEIPEISSILLAGKSSRINARDFFASYFETATVSYLASTSQALGNLPTNELQGQTFSEFAVPIALAWKLLEPNHPAFIPLNLLPQDLIDQQQVLKLNYYGYALLAITGLAAFFFTWQIIQTRGQIRTIESQNAQLEMRIKSNQSTVDRVLDIENESNRLKKHMALADSLGRKHDALIAFLQKLNASVGQTGSIWVDEIVKQADGFTVRGTSMNRAKVPVLAELLERANLRRMTRADSSQAKLFAFELERREAADNFEFSENGIRIIDASQFNANRNLVLTTSGAARGEEAPAPTAVAQTPAVAAQPEAPLSAAVNPAASPPAAVPPARRPTAQQPLEGTLGSALAKAAAAKTATPKPVSEERKLGSQSERIAERQSKNAPAQPERTNKPENAAPSPARSSVPQREKQALATARLPNGAANRSNTAPVAAPVAAASPENEYPGKVEAMTCHTKELAEWYASGYRKRGIEAIVAPYYDKAQGMQWFRVMIGKQSSPATRRETPDTKMVQTGTSENGAGKNVVNEARQTTITAKPAASSREEDYGDKVEAITCHTKELAEWYAAGYRRRGIEALVVPFYDKNQGMEVYRVMVSKQTPRTTIQRDLPQPKMAMTAAQQEAHAKGYTIEAVTSELQQPPEQIATTYRRQGMDVTVEPYQDAESSQLRYRLLIGTFATREAAEKKAAEIGNMFIKSYRIVMLK